MKKIKHIITEIAFAFMRLPMRGQSRTCFARWGGVRIVGHRHFIGRGVCFDAVAPEMIHIGDHVHITDGCVFLTHFLDTNKPGINWSFGEIHIGSGAFIGARTVIAKPCKIGMNAIVGAGSVVTKDIPDNEIWAGNPAKFIKKRQQC